MNSSSRLAIYHLTNYLFLTKYVPQQIPDCLELLTNYLIACRNPGQNVPGHNGPGHNGPDFDNIGQNIPGQNGPTKRTCMHLNI